MPLRLYADIIWKAGKSVLTELVQRSILSIYIYIYIKMRVSGLLQYHLQRLMQPYEIVDRYKSKASVLHIEST